MRPFLLLAPAIAVMLVSGVVPMGFVAFYSVHDTFAGNDFVFVGAHWFRQVLTSPEFFAAFGKSLAFSALALAIQLPLGIAVALKLPKDGWFATIAIVITAIPLLTPTIVVGYLWKTLTLPNAGLLYEALSLLGIQLNMNSVAANWLVLVLMDAWHWTSLVVLLSYAGLKAIPEDYYRAASIDGASRWAVFRHVQLPRLKLVLLIAILLRFMDSFMVYAEAYALTRGGPGVSTTFLSNELVQTALVQFDLGEGGAISIIYFTIVFLVSLAFFNFILPAREWSRR